jgi:ssDNA-binding Zn-finger/Zn-ribbon topoisomerase 1
MIIYGSAGREVFIGEGQFHCPQCDSPQHFRHNRMARYFTLYFIPLFEISSHGEFVQCSGCSGQFVPDVIHYRPPSAGDRLALALREELGGGMPLHMAVQKLVTAGADQQTAQQMVQAACEGRTAHCPNCNFYYSAAVLACTNCGGQLAQHPG